MTTQTQGNVAIQMGVSRPHLNAVLQGKRQPSGKLAVRLEEITGVPASVWIAGTPEQKRTAWRQFRATQQ